MRILALRKLRLKPKQCKVNIGFAHAVELTDLSPEDKNVANAAEKSQQRNRSQLTITKVINKCQLK